MGSCVVPVSPDSHWESVHALPVGHSQTSDQSSARSLHNTRHTSVKQYTVASEWRTWQHGDHHILLARLCPFQIKLSATTDHRPGACVRCNGQAVVAARQQYSLHKIVRAVAQQKISRSSRASGIEASLNGPVRVHRASVATLVVTAYRIDKDARTLVKRKASPRARRLVMRRIGIHNARCAALASGIKLQCVIQRLALRISQILNRMGV